MEPASVPPYESPRSLAGEDEELDRAALEMDRSTYLNEIAKLDVVAGLFRLPAWDMLMGEFRASQQDALSVLRGDEDNLAVIGRARGRAQALKWLIEFPGRVRVERARLQQELDRITTVQTAVETGGLDELDEEELRDEF